MSLTKKTKRIYLDSSREDWVDVRSLSIGELREFRQAVAKVEPLAGEEQTEAQGYELSRLVLEHCIVAWSDEEPVTPEHIARLPYAFTFRLTEAAGLTDKRDEDIPLESGSLSSVSSIQTEE